MKPFGVEIAPGVWIGSLAGTPEELRARIDRVYAALATRPEGKLRTHLYSHLRNLREALARTKGTHTHEQWIALRDSANGICPRCGRPDYLEKDHIAPIALGGSDGIENLQPLCTHCNLSKGIGTVIRPRSRRKRKQPTRQFGGRTVTLHWLKRQHPEAWSALR